MWRFFDDDKGQQSSMRLMCFLSMLTAIGLSALYALDKACADFNLNLILYFLLAAIGGKSAQKLIEKAAIAKLGIQQQPKDQAQQV